MTDRYILNIPPAASPAASPVSALTLDKAVLKVGHYKHPVKGWTLEVDRARLDRMAATLTRMLANGVSIDVTTDHSQSAKDVLGKVTSARVVDDWLILRHRFADAEGAALARRVGEVSVEIEPQFSDGHGNKYQDAIVASSVVRQPVVPGQSGFKIAASLIDPTNPLQKDKPMIQITIDGDSMSELIDLARVATLTPGRASPKVTPQQALRAVLAAQAFEFGVGNVEQTAGGGAAVTIDIDKMPDETDVTFWLERLIEADKVPVARRMMSRNVNTNDAQADPWVEQAIADRNG